MIRKGKENGWGLVVRKSLVANSVEDRIVGLEVEYLFKGPGVRSVKKQYGDNT